MSKLKFKLVLIHATYRYLEVAYGAAAGRGAAGAGVCRRQRTEVGHLLGR